ncbi:MAG: carbohydrate ABC transporter substrate-binding protein, partial [Eubacterium sp.]
MKFLKKIVSLFCVCALVMSTGALLASCKSNNTLTVRYLNFKPEVASVYQELAKAYEEETGIRVVADTAANN